MEAIGVLYAYVDIRRARGGRPLKAMDVIQVARFDGSAHPRERDAKHWPLTI